jgi:hypothetical protein
MKTLRQKVVASLAGLAFLAIALLSISMLAHAQTSAPDTLTSPGATAVAIADEKPVILAGGLHKVLLGSAAISVGVIKVGSEGWVLVQILENAAGMTRGEQFWVNTRQILLISPPLQPSR